MDFLTLPRRDLQALCKRNGVRANMTNAAMADALLALPKVDGIEEYVKQPVRVSQPVVKAVVGEQNIGKQGSPLPRGRRAVAMSSEPIEPEEDTEEEKGNAKRQSSKEDAQALGVGRRGASRRARPVPVVLQPAAVAEEDSQGKEDLKRESKRDNATAPVVGRRGASRRARPSPAVTAPAAEAEAASAAEEQREDEVEDLKREASMDDVPALGVGRRGDSRRARPAPSVAALAGKVVAEEQQPAPIPRGRHVKAKGSSSEPIRLDDSDDEEKEDAKPEDAQILGVGRRGGASRRALPAPAVAAPEAKAEEEQRAPVPRGRCVKANSTELIRLDDSKEEKQEDTKPEEEKGGAPAIAVGRRGANRRASAPSEAPAAAGKAEGGDAALEAVPIRAARQRKPTMKAAAAAAAAEENAPRRATRRGAVMTTLLQQEAQEEPQEAVGAPEVAVEAVPIRATRRRKPTMKAAAAATAEEKAPARATRRGAVMRTVLQPEVQEEPHEAVGAPVSYQQYDAQEELEEAFDPQKEELNGVDAPKQDKNEDVVITEDEKLMEETPAEGPSVTDQECTGNSEMQEQQMDDEKCRAPLATQEESPILGLVSTVTEQASKDDEGASFEDDGGSSSGLLDKGGCEETYDAGDEMKLVPGVQTLQAPLTGNKSEASDANHESEMGNFNEVPTVREEISEVDTQEVSKEKEHMDIAELQADIVDEAAFLDCSSNISQVTGEENNEEVNTAGEETNEDVNIEDGLGCQEEGFDKVLHDSVDNTLLLDCSSDISWVEMEKAGNVTSVMRENPVALDEHGDKPNEVVIGDNMSQVTVTDEVVQEQKGVLITNEMLQGTVEMHDDIEDDQFETVFVHAHQVVTADNLLEQVTDCEITVEENTALIVDERQRSTVTMDEDAVQDHSETDGVHSNEQIEVVTTDKVPELELIEDIFVQAYHIVAAENLPEQLIDCENIVETTSLLVDQKQKSTVTMDKDVVSDHFKTDVVHADEQMEVAATDEVPELTETDDEVVDEMKTPLIVDEKQQGTVTMNEDTVDNHFKTHVAHTDEQKEVVATEVPEVTGSDSEVEEKTTLIVDEKKQTTITMDEDVVFDHLKTDTAHADEQKEVIVIVTEVPDDVTGTDDEVVEEKAVVITEDIPNEDIVPSITHTMDECVKENHFGNDFGHGSEQMKAITAHTEPEVSRAQDGGARKENALLDDVTESLSKSIITMEPSVWKNSSEKNTAEPMAVLEEKGMKVASESEDLTKLSLGQLRAKLKRKLNAKKNKEAKKRVALARVDENVCRSHAKGQQQNLNLQQH